MLKLWDIVDMALNPCREVRVNISRCCRIFAYTKARISQKVTNFSTALALCSGARWEYRSVIWMVE